LATHHGSQGRSAFRDGQIVAITRACGAVLLATRDLGGFQDCGVPIINPWRA